MRNAIGLRKDGVDAVVIEFDANNQSLGGEDGSM
jgi:hypothetical protein